MSKEEYLAKRRARYENNKEHYKAYAKRWREANKDKVAEYNRRYLAKVNATAMEDEKAGGKAC